MKDSIKVLQNWEDSERDLTEFFIVYFGEKKGKSVVILNLSSNVLKVNLKYQEVMKSECK